MNISSLAGRILWKIPQSRFPWDLLRSRKSPKGSILFIRRIMEISYKALDLLPVLTIKSAKPVLINIRMYDLFRTSRLLSRRIKKFILLSVVKENSPLFSPLPSLSLSLSVCVLTHEDFLFSLSFSLSLIFSLCFNKSRRVFGIKNSSSYKTF